MVWGFSALLPHRAAGGPGAHGSRGAAGRAVSHRPLLGRGARRILLAAESGRLGGRPAKLTYGESFAIYALAEYSTAYGDPEALQYAARAFELLQIYAADTQNGGYLENLERDFHPRRAAPSPGTASRWTSTCI
jgi:mannobiose 2-epimerase